MDEFLHTLLVVTGRLESAGFDYMVTGSVALMFYGTPRMTRDVDIRSIDLDETYLERWADDLGVADL